MQPFAENTVTAIGELRRLERPPTWLRLRKYQGHAAVDQAGREYEPFLQLLHVVSTYSLQLVALNDAKASDARKIRELVRYLRENSPHYLSAPGGKGAEDEELLLTPTRFEESIEEVSRQKTFLDALGAVDPIVAAVQARGLALSDRVTSAIADAAGTLEGLVLQEYGAMVANREALVALQTRLHRAQALAEQAILGDAAALEALRRDVPMVNELLRPDRRPTVRELQPVVEALAVQLHRVQISLEQVRPEYDAYRESLAELDAMRNHYTERARVERSILLVWARSHRNLGRGVEVPPAFDLARIVTSSASKVTGAVLPFKGGP